MADSELMWPVFGSGLGQFQTWEEGNSDICKIKRVFSSDLKGNKVGFGWWVWIR